MAKKRRKKNNKKKDDTDNDLKVYKVNGSQKRQAKMRRERSIQAFLVVLIVILLIAAVFSGIKTFFPNLFGSMSLSGKLAARVNNQVITMQQLNTEYDRLPLQYKYFITKEAFLNQLIDETLLIEESSRLGLFVTEEEINDKITEFMQDNNVSEERLGDILEEKGLTYPAFRLLISNQLLIDELIKQEVKNKISVTTEQALTYYNDNPETFKIPELTTAKHILVSSDERTEEEAEARADMVLFQLEEDKSNFCGLVNQYSDDAGSMETCGEYTFPRGQMVEEFEETAFTQETGGISMVQTLFGYHIIWTVNKTPEQLIPFKDVQEQIIIILEQQQEKMLYSDLSIRLKENAVIINYLEEAEVEEVIEEPETDVSEPQAEPVEEAGEIEIVIEEPVIVIEEEVPEVEEIELIEEEIVEEQEELEEEVEIVIEEVVEEEEEVVVEEEPIVISEINFAQCLTDYGAVLYGAFWDSSTKKQKDYFGSSDIDKISYVECGVVGDYRAQTTECADAGILAYPTWEIDGELHMGIMEPEHLNALTGCEK